VRRPVAYHIWTSAPGVTANVRRVRERIPADEILHGFIPLEEEQTRGVPWMHAAMRILNDLKGYREAAVIAARIGASKMGVWVTPDGGPPPGSDDTTGNGDHITDVQPGTFDFAPDGYTFKEFNPAYPHDQFDAFCKATLRGVASAIGAAYSTLANDLENVNYSSIRAGVLDERDEWMVIQNVVINQLLTPIFEDWMAMSLLRGAVRLPTGSALPASKLDKFLAHMWQGRRWQWVDPEKDVNAAVTALANKLASPQQIAMQTGRDVDEILDDWVAYEAMCKARGIPVPTFATTAAPPAPAPDPNQAK
jgi:lambda family phage portal protein